MIEVRFFLRIPPDTRIGLGKVKLLEAVEKTGSISAAARRLGMTYRRAWDLLNHMSKAFGQPVVDGHVGSAGGAELTDLGREVIERYRRIEEEILTLSGPHVLALDSLVSGAASLDRNDDE